MPKPIKLACAMLVFPALTACLQVELYGPVAAASISISPLRGGPAVVENFSSDSVLDSEARWGSQKWASFLSREQLWLLGGADVPTDKLLDDTLYLVTARGGLDQDANEDGMRDGLGELIFGEWHAVTTGAQLKQPLTRVSVLTEALYQTLLPELDALSDAEVIPRLDELAGLVIEDINNDGRRDYSDALAWTTMSNTAHYRGPAIFLERVRDDVQWGLSASIHAEDGSNAIRKAGWKPAVANGSYADFLVSCATPVLIRDLCELQQLPLLASITAAPTIEDVMQRVVVSHTWMATRFEQFLRQMPEELLLLTRSLSGVVIAADVRPSYYNTVNSVIYLDADTFWLTDAERESVSTEEDYRSEFARQFAFSDLWRYVLGAESIFAVAEDVDELGNRELERALPPAAALLFHELAHANDQVPSRVYQQLDPFLTLYEQSWVLPSDILAAEMPLQSRQLRDLAAALYRGSTATSQQKAYSGDTVGRLFDPDGASDLYAYSSQREDLAMLFEEFMMRRHYGLNRDIAFTNNPADDPECADFTVSWGVRGRIGAAQLRPRLAQVLEELLPGQDFSAELSQLPTPIAMRKGKDWCDNLILGEERLAGRPPAAALRRPAPPPDRKPRPYL